MTLDLKTMIYETAVSQTARVKAAKNVIDSPKRGFKFTVEGRVADAAPASAATTREYPVIDHDYDACVVGAGGAGLRAAFGLVQEGFKTAVITKVFISHSEFTIMNHFEIICSIINHQSSYTIPLRQIQFFYIESLILIFIFTLLVSIILRIFP